MHALTRRMSALLALGAVVALSAAVLPDRPASSEPVVVPFFGNAKCPMNPTKDIDQGASITVDGQAVYFCCKNCVKKAKADPKAWLAKAYPERKKLGGDQCPMTGREIVPEKKVTVVHESYEVDLCCKNCEKKFRENPYVALVRILHPKATWVNNKKCPSMPEEDVMADVLVLYKDHVVNLCCEMCIDDFKAEPDKMLALAKKNG